MDDNLYEFDNTEGSVRYYRYYRISDIGLQSYLLIYYIDILYIYRFYQHLFSLFFLIPCFFFTHNIYKFKDIIILIIIYPRESNSNIGMIFLLKDSKLRFVRSVNKYR